jgi:hypothetical protein
VTTMTPPHRCQHYILRKDDSLRAVNGPSPRRSADPWAAVLGPWSVWE